MRPPNLFEELWKESLSRDLTTAFIVRKCKISWIEAERLLKKIQEKHKERKDALMKDFTKIL